MSRSNPNFVTLSSHAHHPKNTLLCDAYWKTLHHHHACVFFHHELNQTYLSHDDCWTICHFYLSYSPSSVRTNLSAGKTSWHHPFANHYTYLSNQNIPF